MKAISLALISALTLGACANKSADHAEAARVTVATPAAAGSAAAPGTDGKGGLDAGRPVDPRKVVRTGHISMVVATYDEARAQLDALTQSVGGYVDSTQVDRRQGSISDATLVIRIPSGAFTSLLPQLRALGEITSETTSATDITDQYIDTTARIASAEVLEKRMLELATERNGNIDQVLSVERELARVRGEIEADEGHIRQWSDQIALSTLTISMSTRRAELAVAAPPSLGSRTSDAFHSSISALGDLGGWCVVHGIAFLPWLLILLPGGVLVRRLARRDRRELPAAIALPTPPSA